MAQQSAIEVSEACESLVVDTVDEALQAVREGKVAKPFAFTLSEDGSKTLHRLMANDMPEAERMLESIVTDPKGAVRAYAFATDCLIHLADGTKQDAIFVEAGERGAAHGVTFIQHYQKAELGKEFGPLGNPALSQERPRNRFERAPAAPQQGGLLPDEWQKLRTSPVLLFLVTAAIDGSLDKKEVAAFQKIVTNANAYQSKLMRQVLADIVDDVPTMVMQIMSQPPDFMQVLSEVADLVDAKLSGEDAHAYKMSLMHIGKSVAEASGGFFGFGSKISDEEKAALAAAFVALRIKA